MPPTLSSTLACDVVTARVDSWPRRWLLGSDRPVNLVPVAVALDVSVQEALAVGRVSAVVCALSTTLS
jgi:hypothetical protein